jgi:UTP--glucose-1-phosphate uridylyltransferase
MKIRKAIITAAARGQRALPLQALVDRDGTTRSALQIIIGEAVSAGVEDVCLVVAPGDQETYGRAAGEHAGRLHFVEQHDPRGYGHALYAARAMVGDEPFLHLVSDHLYLSKTDAGCARQLVEVAAAESCAVSGVQATREAMLPYYGTIGGRRLAQRGDLYEIETVVEKPTPTEAEQSLIVPGLRAGHYLCFFGMHVLTPAVMEILEELLGRSPRDASVALSPALERLAGRERYLALEVKGWRYNIGVQYGLLNAQLALALAGEDREEVLAQLVELLALRGT